MAALLDTFPFPWHLPEAQELHLVLCEIYPTAKAALFVAARGGVNVAMINSDQSAFLVWKDILDLASVSARLRPVAEQVRDQNPNNPKRAFLDALINSTTPPRSPEPRAGDGSPRFIKGTDDITEPEALLFHDDLTLGIGRLPWLIGVLQKLQALAPAVCRLTVNRIGAGLYGTGFRIADDLILTNWHVIGGATAATTITAEFGYDDDGQGGGTATNAIVCDVTSITGGQDDDWAVIRPQVPLPATAPIIKLSEAVDPAVNVAAFIIQHPGGDRKRVAYVRNQVTLVDDRVVQYLSDTQGGSSGSPVLNGDGHLIGLHHAGGRPQEVAGKPPAKKNEGVRIPRVLAGLAAAAITVP